MQISDEFKKYSDSPEQFQIFTNEISVVNYKYLEIRKQEEAMTSKHLIIYSEQNLISHHNKNISLLLNLIKELTVPLNFVEEKS